MALVLLGLGGCAAFPQAATPRGPMPDLSQAIRKPDVFAEVHLFRGQPGLGAEAITLGHGRTLEAIKQALTDSGLFHTVSFDAAHRDPAEFRLRVEVYEACSQNLNLAAEALTTYTLGLLPMPTTQAFTVKITLSDASGKTLNTAENADGVRVWLGLWMLPISRSHTVENATADTLGNQVRMALTQLYESGQLAGGYVLPPSRLGPVMTAKAARAHALPQTGSVSPPPP